MMVRLNKGDPLPIRIMRQNIIPRHFWNNIHFQM